MDLKAWVLLLAFFFLGIISLLGVRINQNEPVSSVGAFQLRAFFNGLNLYQESQSKKDYYLFSPINDYYLNETGERIPMATYEQLALSSSLKGRLNYFYEMKQAGLGYFNLISPSVTYTTSFHQYQYQTKVNRNRLEITRSFIFKPPQKLMVVGTTITYHANDFIFDDQRLMYYAFHEVATLEKLTGLSFTKLQTALREEIKGRTVYVANPELSGLIALQLDPGQKAYINRSDRLIEIEEAVSHQVHPYESNTQVKILELDELD